MNDFYENKKVKPLVVAFLAVFLCAIFQMAQATETKPIVFKATAYGGPKYAQRVVFERAMKTIKEKTKGGIKFEYYPGTSLLKLTQTFEALKNNVIQIGITSSEYEKQRMGIIGASNTLPFSWDVKKWHRHWRDPGMYFDLAEPVYNKNNLHLLASPRVYCDLHSKMPVHKLEDLKGRMIRASGSIPPAIKLLGAEPTFIALSDIYAALQRGLIDGACTSHADYVSKKRYEVAPYLLIASLYGGSLNHVMNLQVYKSLSPEMRKIIDDAFLEAEKWWGEEGVEKDEKELLEEVKKHGGTIYYLPDDQFEKWKKAMEPFWEEMAKKYPNDYPRLKPIIEKLSR